MEIESPTYLAYLSNLGITDVYLSESVKRQTIGAWTKITEQRAMANPAIIEIICGAERTK